MNCGGITAYILGDKPKSDPRDNQIITRDSSGIHCSRMESKNVPLLQYLRLIPPPHALNVDSTTPTNVPHTKLHEGWVGPLERESMEPYTLDMPDTAEYIQDGKR